MSTISVTHRTIEGESVILDNKIFRDCKFIDCVLEYSGGEVTLERTDMVRCSYMFLGAANSTLRMFQLLGVIPATFMLCNDDAGLVH